MEEVCKEIKRLRKSKGYTLKDVSERTGLSVSFLSQLERGTSSLAITSLKKIADSFDVPIRQFFLTESNVNYVLKREEQKSFRFESSPVVYSRLNGEFDGRGLEPILVTLAPRVRQEVDSHPGEEFYYVVKGEILVQLDQEEYVVGEGDTIHFPSHVPHGWENLCDEEAVLLCIVTPVVF
ncbi:MULTISPECIES: helix-turn-helix domain-containing protein [Bhargavaea]|uniref:Helix-turn-helix domain-containing protein n=1 Tax=Bhargavaea changchunensis TaxID=2134037 RepID=A0ABW2NDH8_9BACL|nr:XRE family transcriptional regulator [Bhargavaea sp. CC-171006]